ncbi:conserved hypothetical protein [Neospora caninum Liverpool]|uniref:Uncharacterized protein n=1 Tax=Neospora caninum (strain Liverpool) TaxID=572307 RepID=F0VNN5_NEOCL|nr:conserved hypothetical protein [Neospora caninum Liverpool]CBZ55331.1 conserved hypothetical protein [Neospora caninum Liverpool]CEL70063.1 TPA: hypothetical protein BN1204_057540 [Neospora caninum Liverpool]|eukprot:XP_003885359.1 conserved hypothetical protein [Neospora caninum Liverpool]
MAPAALHRRPAGRGAGGKQARGGKDLKLKKGKGSSAAGRSKGKKGAVEGGKRFSVKKKGKKSRPHASGQKKAEQKQKHAKSAGSGRVAGRKEAGEKKRPQANRTSAGDELEEWDFREGRGKEKKAFPQKKRASSDKRRSASASGEKPAKERKPRAGEKPAKKKKSFEEQLREYLDEQAGRTGKRAGDAQETSPAPRSEKEVQTASAEKGGGVETETQDASSAVDSLSVSKKRKLMNEMKLSHRNEDAGYIKQCFRLYGQLLATRPEQQNAGTPQVAERVKDLLEFILPRVKEGDRHLCTSRALQALLKFGSKEQRLQLWAILKDDFAELCLGKTVCQVAMKFYLYGDKETQEEITQLLSRNKDIFFSKFGSRVWEYVYTGTKSAKGQQQMLNAVMLPPLAMVRHPDYQEAPTFFELFEKFDVETRKLTMEHIASLLQKFVDKELLDKAPVHRMLKIFTRLANEEQLNAVLQMTLEGFLRLAATKDGVDAMVRLLGYATAKQRKSVVKEMKKVMVSMTTNPVDYLLVLRLLCTVDDTKLLRDVLIKELTKEIGTIAFDPQGYFVLLQLLDTSSEPCKHLPLHTRQMLQLPSPTSLKPFDVRVGELRAPIVEALEKELEEAAERPSTASLCSPPKKMRKNHLGMKASAEAEPSEGEGQQEGDNGAEETEKTKGAFKDWLENQYASRVFVEFLKVTKSPKILELLIGELGNDEKSLRGFVDHPHTQRLLSSLVKQADETWEVAGSPERSTEHSDGNSRPSFIGSLWLVLAPRLSAVLASRGVFLATDILQASRRLHAKALEKQIVQALEGDALQQARKTVQAEGLSTAGLDMLSSKLKEN